MNSKIAIVFGLLALLGAVSVSASDFEDAIDFESDAIHRTAVAVDGFDANPYFTNNIAEDEAFFASASSRSLQKTTTCSNPSAATDIYILDANKQTLWCAYNDTLIVKMTNNPTNQALDVCKWRWVYCYGATTYTLIYQGISGTNKFLYCQTTGTYDFCGKMVMSDALTDLGQFWIRTNAFALDTLYNNLLSKYASNSNGMLATNVNAYYFKMCEPAYLGSC